MMLQRQNPIRRSLIPVALGAAASLGALTVAPGSARACGDPSTIYIGTVCMTAGSYCPRDFMPADGRLLDIADFNALFAVMGCEYGGNCSTTFALPDLRARSPVGAGTAPGLMPVQRGVKRGVETVTQTVDTMAPHSHTITATGPATGGGTIDVVPGAASGTTEPAAGTTYHLGAVGGKADDGPYTTASAGGDPAKVAGVSVTMDSTGLEADPTGTGEPQINLPPQTAVLVCVAVDGLFPPRN
jgi:microcystin-dependent protein